MKAWSVLINPIFQVYKVLVPIFEVAYDFKKLADFHQKMHDSYKSIADVNESGKRIFATYYRLAFFGDPKVGT
jgi:hypothetical protein